MKADKGSKPPIGASLPVRRITLRGLAAGAVLGCGFLFAGSALVDATSTDRFCEICHVHPHATETWKLSTHYDNPSGIVVHCVECHLPPRGFAHLFEKTKLGVRDAYSTLFKDPAQIDWKEKATLEAGLRSTFEASCLRCHQNLFPAGLSEKGANGHRSWEQNRTESPCLKCHLRVGHRRPEEIFGAVAEAGAETFSEAAAVAAFESFVERIPGTSLAFEMIAIPGGTFTMGSPGGEEGRRPDEGPQRTVAVSPFWMGKTEVTWEEYETFYAQTAAEGRTDTRAPVAADGGPSDAVTGPTPPWGDPGQGWGRGQRPAITMSHHAATVYCRWLSQVTGKRYRLPAEAEWEYACRAGTTGPWFFEGDPGCGPAGKPFAFFAANSNGTTHAASEAEPNPFGLLNMAGNVCEFCLDRYAPDAYASAPGGGVLQDPRGPAAGREHVIRGGSFFCEPGELRSAARDYTRTDEWLLTDPQIPKSVWWYSDCIDVGFRVVCEGPRPESQ